MLVLKLTISLFGLKILTWLFKSKRTGIFIPVLSIVIYFYNNTALQNPKKESPHDYGIEIFANQLRN